jgi:hypothetical protein
VAQGLNPFIKQLQHLGLGGILGDGDIRDLQNNAPQLKLLVKLDAVVVQLFDPADQKPEYQGDGEHECDRA